MLQDASGAKRMPKPWLRSHGVGPLGSESGPLLCDFRSQNSLLDQKGQGQRDSLGPGALRTCPINPRQPRCLVGCVWS